MSWNYRVIRRIEESHVSKQPVYCIATVFYDADGNITTFSADPAWPVGETPEELRHDIELMRQAFERPLVDEREDGVLIEAMPIPSTARERT
jgi:hypothetical protein